MEPKISIIVPVYNVEQYLERCVESLMNQSYKNIEILLINDGSTDNSGKLCDEIAKRDSRIAVYHKENGGLSDARNYGVDKATADFVGFVDSDDYVDEDMYEVLLSNLLKYDVYYHKSYLHLLILQMTYFSPYEMEAKPNVFSIAIIIPIVTNIKITDNAETDGS